MNKLSIIKEQQILGKQFTIYGTIDEPLFLAKDVADWIEHSNTRMMLNSIDKEEKQCVNNPYASSGQQEQWFLTEDGLYEVLMQSRKPIAKQFKKQVKFILKEIRHNGFYVSEQINVQEFDKLKQQVNLLLRREKERVFATPSPKDYVLRFFEENCEINTMFHIVNINFFVKYQDWCRRIGITPISDINVVLGIITDNISNAEICLFHFTHALKNVAWKDKTIYQRGLL